jgi:hypothetical protein
MIEVMMMRIVVLDIISPDGVTDLTDYAEPVRSEFMGLVN